LIQVKHPGITGLMSFHIKMMEVHMPVDSIMVAIAVVVMFATLGFVLAWGDRRTRNL